MTKTTVPCPSCPQKMWMRAVRVQDMKDPKPIITYLFRCSGGHSIHGWTDGPLGQVVGRLRRAK